MKIYIAARYSRKDEVARLAGLMRKVGVTVVSTWHDEAESQIPETSFDANREHFLEMANRDLSELDTAESIVFFSESPTVGVPRGGRHVEFGYFLKMKRAVPQLRITVIGPTENLFHTLIDEQYPDMVEYVFAMAQRIVIPTP